MSIIRVLIVGALSIFSATAVGTSTAAEAITDTMQIQGNYHQEKHAFLSIRRFDEQRIGFVIVAEATERENEVSGFAIRQGNRFETEYMSAFGNDPPAKCRIEILFSDRSATLSYPHAPGTDAPLCGFDSVSPPLGLFHLTNHEVPKTSDLGEPFVNNLDLKWSTAMKSRVEDDSDAQSPLTALGTENLPSPSQPVSGHAEMAMDAQDFPSSKAGLPCVREVCVGDHMEQVAVEMVPAPSVSRYLVYRAMMDGDFPNPQPLGPVSSLDENRQIDAFSMMGNGKNLMEPPKISAGDLKLLTSYFYAGLSVDAVGSKHPFPHVDPDDARIISYNYVELSEAREMVKRGFGIADLKLASDLAPYVATGRFDNRFIELTKGMRLTANPCDPTRAHIELIGNYTSQSGYPTTVFASEDASGQLVVKFISRTIPVNEGYSADDLKSRIEAKYANLPRGSVSLKREDWGFLLQLATPGAEPPLKAQSRYWKPKLPDSCLHQAPID